MKFLRNLARPSLQKMVMLLALFLCISSSQVYAYRFVVYADSRSLKGDPNPFNQEILGFINSQIRELHPHPKFVLFLGDTVNRTFNTLTGRNNLADWKAFMEVGLGSIPFYVAVGNTDLYGDTGFTEFPNQAVFQETFSELPDNGPPSYKKLAYFFEFGEGKEHSLFAVLDSFGFFEQDGMEVNFDNGYDSEQIAWFYQLSASSKAFHKFGFSHGPAFSVEGFPVKDSVKVVWNLMEEFNYDLFYCGHEHLYSRWTIGKKQYPLATRKFTQVIAGSAGAKLDDISNVKNKKQKHVHANYNYVVVDVNGPNVTQIAYAVVRNESSGKLKAKIIDQFTLQKQKCPPFQIIDISP